MSIKLANELGKWCTGNISDALVALGYQAAIHHDIRPIYTPINIAGRALTIKVERTKREGDKMDAAQVAKENCKPGDVVVIDCGGYRHGQSVNWGENSAVSCQVRGAVGMVIDGGCRDTRALKSLKIPVFCRAISPGGLSGTLYTVDYNVPIVLGGIRVHPGDIVVGDDDGVCVIPQEIAERALEVVKVYGEKDQAVAPALRAGKSVAEAYALKRDWKKIAGL
ncbi:MAG: RraA family protein [Candidatus Bathyarchaeia archaeon]